MIVGIPTTQPTNPKRPVTTVRVASLKTYLNGLLADSVDDYTRERAAIASVLAKVLLDANTYHGFWFTDGANGENDPTRRQYF